MVRIASTGIDWCGNEVRKWLATVLILDCFSIDLVLDLWCTHEYRLYPWEGTCDWWLFAHEMVEYDHEEGPISMEKYFIHGCDRSMGTMQHIIGDIHEAEAAGSF